MSDLFNSDDPKLWISYLNKYDCAIKSIAINKKKEEFVNLDKWLWNSLKKDVCNRNKIDPVNGYYLTKVELSNIMKWKLIRGNFRPLQKLIDSNTEDNVKLCTGNALTILYNDQLKWKKAATELIKLKGVGIATASIILALFTKCCPFMSDEVIESVYDNEIKYTLPVYVVIQEKLENKMKMLNFNGDTKFDVAMIEKALWTFVVST